MSYKKIAVLGLLIAASLSACAQEELNPVPSEGSNQESSSKRAEGASKEEPDSKSVAASAKTESTVAAGQSQKDESPESPQLLNLLTTPFVEADEYWGVQPFAIKSNQLGVQFHNGIDYFTSEEKVAIQAVSSGRVMFVDVYERKPDGAFQINLAWQTPTGEVLSYSLEPSAGPADQAKIANQKLLAQKMMDSMTIRVGDQIVEGQLLGYLYGQDEWAHVHMSLKASARGPEKWLCPADYMATLEGSDLLPKSLIWADRLYKGSKRPQLCNY